MWNLSGSDIEQAKEQLKGRRAAIKARYDDEMKRVEDALAEIDSFERAAQEFVSHYKGDEAPSETPEETEPMPEEPAVAGDPAAEENDPVPAHVAAEEHAEASEPNPVEAAVEPTGASRWRMRLNGGSVTEAA